MAQRKLFVNLAIRNLKRSVEFFTKLGFRFNPQFTSADTTCMIVNEEAYFMLLEEKRFAEFSAKPLCDTSTHTEGLFAVMVESRAAVDELVQTAIAAGGTHAKDKIDMGFMYGWSFFDLDGHHWEVGYLDPAHVRPRQP